MFALLYSVFKVPIADCFTICFESCFAAFFYSPFGLNGDGEIRTHDPLLARQVLSQLSYTPTVHRYYMG